MLGRLRKVSWTQEKIVFLIAIAMFCVFSVFLNGFLSSGNLITLVRSVSVLGILGVGMAILVIGRGIDLAIVAIYAMSAAWTLHLANAGVPILLAMLMAYLFALSAGVLSGVLIAYVEMPPLFATLGMASFIYGFARWALVPLYVVYMPASASGIAWIGGGFVFGLPTPILFFAIVALLGFVFLRFTKAGRFIYAIGDNPAAARISGAPVRPIIVLQYAIVGDGRLSRRHHHRNRRRQHGHRRRELLVDLRRRPGRRHRRHRFFGRARRHPQRDRRHAADRHPAQRDDHHEHRIHAAKRDPQSDPARRDRHRQHLNPLDEQISQQGDI